MLSFAQIPQSTQNPLLGELYRPALDAEEKHRQAMDDWRRTSLDTVDRAILDPDGFYADKPLPFHPDQQLARTAVTVRSYLTVANDGKPVTGDLYPAHLRDKIARERFDGRGIGSDEAFFTEIQKEAVQRKETLALAHEMQSAATTGALIRETSEAGIDSKSFQLWREEAKVKPGYQRGMDFAYLEAWNDTQAALKQNIEPYLGPLKQVWQSMQSGGADWYGAWEQVPAENRDQFMASLAIMARSLPAEQQPTFWGNLAKQATRDIQGQAINVMEGIGTALDTGSPLNDYDPVGEFNAAAADRSRKNFIADVERIRNETFDPVKVLNPDSAVLRTLERGAYAAPGAIATSAAALVPLAGPVATYYHMEESAYRDMRRTLMDGGMSDADASATAEGLAPIIAIPQAALERIGAGALVGKLPGLEKVLAATANRLTSTAGRYAGRTVAIAGFETAIENAQDLIPSILQDAASALDKEVPGVVWKNGKDGFFDGYWEKTATTAVAILPLALIGGAGGLSAEGRAKAFAETPDLHLRVLGIPADGVARIRAAQAQGRYQAEAAIEAELAARDPMGEDAKDATQELAEALQAEKAAVAAASDAGIMPRAVRSTDGSWTLYDTGTGAEIGQASDWQGAARLATAHANFTAEEDSDRIATVFTAYQAAEASGKWGEQHDRPNETNLDLGRSMTAEEAAGQSAAARQRVEAQERLAGGDGSVAQMVFGQSRTEMADGLYKTTNRILEGGSVLDIFHEETHGFRRIAHARGILTLADDIAVLRAVDTVLSGTTREGERLAILPADFDSLSAADQEVAVDEGISKLMESEVLRTRKGGGKRDIPAGIVSKNLAALGRLLGNPRLGKFRAFINAIREHFGLALDRAALIKRGLADGTLDRASYDSYLQKLLGIDEQIAFEQMARDAEAEIINGAELVPAADGDPFSLGRSRDRIRLPDAIIGHQLAQATQHPDYQAAKTGDNAAAVRLAADMVTPEMIASLRGITATIVPVLAVEDSGRNKIPLAVAGRLADALTLDLTTEILQAAQVNRSAASGLDRVFISPPFAGAVTRGKAYILVDDTLTQGGTFAALADHITRNGGTIAATVALTGKNYSRTLSLSDDTLQRVRSRLGDLEADFREATGHGFDALTESEGRTLATWSPVDAVRTRILAERDARLSQGDGSNAGSFSLGSARLGVLTGDSIRRIQNPLRRAQAMERVSRKLEDLRLEAERLELLSGTKRLKRSLAREASIRQALRQSELENEAWARHAAILSDDDLTKLRAQPGHALFSNPNSHLNGRLMSKTAAMKKHPDLFQLHAPGEYDGSENVSRSLFGGTLTPDLAAQEAFEAGLIKSPYTDDLWQLLESEARHVSAMKQVLEAAKADLREARTVAKAETNAWLATQADTQATVYSPRQEILRTLSALDAILSSVPAEIRGKIGGYVQAARIADGDDGLEFLRERLAKVDLELEKWLKSQYNLEFLALLDRARPEKDEAGKRPRGKIGADVHSLFADLREAMTLTAAETEAEATRLEILAEQEDLTPEQQAHAMLQANLVRLVGDWPRASAARREAAVLEATRVFESGYMAEKIRMSRQREDRGKKRTNLAAATGKAGTREERRTRATKDEATRTGRVLKAGLSLMSFEQVVQKAFGEGTPDAEALVDWERRAAHAKADALQNKLDLLDDLFASLAGDKLKGEQLRFAMSQPSGITATDAKGRTHTFSQLEAITATLMWRQEDGRRHMEGHVDDQGAPAGEWNYTQAFVDQLEDQLTPEAKAVRLHLAAQYGAEYDRLNSVFRQLYGVSLPRHAHYSPLTVKPAQAGAGQTLDPVTGSTMTGAGLTPGSLKTRSQTAIAEPDFRDALQTYIGHSKQMEHWIAYAPFATEAMALINARNVGNSVEAAAGKETLNTLRGWLDVFAQGGTRDAAAHLAANQIIGRMVGRAAAVALVGRVSVLAIQSTQLAAALAEMPAAAYLTRLARLFAGRLDWSAALRSDYIQRRKATMPPVVQQALEGLSSSKPSRLKYLARKMGETISGADALFTAGTYAITYDYHFREATKMGIADPAGYARQAAERSTDRVAQPVRPGTRSLYEVTGTNPAVRIVWSFASESRQKLMLAAYALGSKKSKGAKARALAVTWLAGGLLASVIRATMRDLRDDDDDDLFDEKNWDPKRLALSALTGPFQGIPFLGDALEATAFKIGGEYLPEGNLFSNAPKAADRTVDLIMGDRPEDLEEAAKDAETILSGAGLFSDSAAAAASFSHLIRDLINIAENATGTD